jgi:ABC-type sugar transport system substrate-binding protein
MNRQIAASIAAAAGALALALASAPAAAADPQDDNQRPGLSNPNNDPDVARGWDQNQQEHQDKERQQSDPNNTRKDDNRDTSENDCGHRPCSSGPDTVPIDQSTYKDRPPD